MINNEIDNTLKNFIKSDIFTPDNIVKIMSDKIIYNNKNSVLEPAVGTGNLLKFLELDKIEKIDVYDIKENYLNDIDKIINNSKIRHILKSKIYQ